MKNVRDARRQGIPYPSSNTKTSSSSPAQTGSPRLPGPRTHVERHGGRRRARRSGSGPAPAQGTGRMAAAEPLIGSLFSGSAASTSACDEHSGLRSPGTSRTTPRCQDPHPPLAPHSEPARHHHSRLVHGRPVCVLTAGFPCQDLSAAGPRTGLASGTRSALWRHVTDAIRTLSPCLVVIENVRGLLSTPPEPTHFATWNPARGAWETHPIHPYAGTGRATRGPGRPRVRRELDIPTRL
ncbi:DNA cytosine methyltransferase [Streptomyces sp. C8S0]|uniref:DNA cytosine methyltransferase n=1 Tax=Streptomyces sp. C8S0 TaxID=2585716 RepID=UPI00299F5879|nr:DNA cytosine methyltransferase [Streptomyces sp. C8S0]